MPVLKTKEEKAKEEKAKIREAALATLAEHKEELDKFKTKIEGQDAHYQEEIALLERRVKTYVVPVLIGDKKKGETIDIRGALSDFEMNKIAELDKIRKTLDLENDLETINQITYVILGVVIANPIMTAKWFATHRTKYSTEDMLTAYLTYQNKTVDRALTNAKRVREIQQFR